MRERLDASPGELLGVVKVDAGHGDETRVARVASLHHHLHEVHGAQRGGEPSRVRRDVDHRLEDAHGLVDHSLGVRDVIAHGQLQPEKVRLEQQVGFGVRIVGEARVHGVPARRLNASRQLGVHLILVVSHGKLVVLRHAAQRAEQLLEGILGSEIRGEQRHAGVLEVIVRRHPAEEERLHAVVLARRHAPRVLELREGVLHQRAEKRVERLVFHRLEVVVARILHQPAEEIRPRDPVHRVLLGRDGARDDLGVEVIRQCLRQGRLHGERLVQEFLVEGFLWLVAHDDAHPALVELRPARATHHLKRVGDWEINVPTRLTVVKLRALDHHEVRGEVHAPRQRGRAHQHLNLTLREESFAHGAVLHRQTGVVQPHAKLQAVPQRRVLRSRHVARELVRRHVHEPVRTLVRGGVGDQIHRRETGLSPGRHEHQRGLLRGVGANRRVGGFVHGHHPRAVKLPGESLDVTLQGHGADGGAKVEQTFLLDAEPVAEIVRVGERGGETDDAHRFFRSGGDVPHAADDNLEDGSAIAAEEVNLVDHHERHLGDVRAAPPVARDAVPLLGRRDDDVGVEQRAKIGRVVSGELHQPLAELRAQVFAPVLDAFAHQRLERGDVHHLLRGGVAEHLHHRKLGGDGLAGPRGGAQKHVTILVVERVKRLRLDSVEVRELALVQRLERRVVQRRPRKWRQVQQIRVRRVLVRQHQPLEVELVERLAPEPRLAGGAQEILGRHRLEDGDGERQVLRPLRVLLLAQRERLGVIDVLVHRVLHPHQPSLRAAVLTVPPHEIRRQSDGDPQHRSRDGLHRRLEPEVRQRLHARLHLPPDVRVEPKHRSNLGRGHVPQAFHRRLTFLEFVQRLGRQCRLELAQRVLMRPDALIHSLGQGEERLRQAGPPSA